MKLYGKFDPEGNCLATFLVSHDTFLALPDSSYEPVPTEGVMTSPHPSFFVKDNGKIRRRTVGELESYSQSQQQRHQQMAKSRPGMQQPSP